MKYAMLLGLLIFMSCQEETAPILFNSTLDLPTEYQYTLSLNCFCHTSYIGPHRLRIRENQILSYELLNGEESIDSSFITDFTIDALNDRVLEIQSQNPVVEEIELHPDYKFPVQVYFDISAMIADEEWGFTISQFEVIED